MRFVELFAGIGGLGAGFEAVGGECVFANEYDKYAVTTYRANNPNVTVHDGDIRDLDAAAVPDHDVLLAGFPCQPFSLAGISKRNALGMPTGLNCHDQGNLFFEAARVIATKRPRVVVLENVKNFVTHNEGHTFRIVRQTLTGMDYAVNHRVLNAAAWVPQHRKRVFIVARRDGEACDLESIAIPAESDWPTMSAVLHRVGDGEVAEPPYTDFLGVSSKYTLTPRLWQYLQAYKEGHAAKGNGFGYGMVGPQSRARTLSARYYKDGSEILVRREGGNPRRLTPRECARLMGFDDSRSPSFTIPVSDTRAYKQFGNAVAVPASTAVAEVVSQCL